jgi:phosphoglycolate phosphatase
MLLLFDIDGTLLQGASRAHAKAIYAALGDVYEIKAIEQAAVSPVPLAGRTDMEIAREIALVHGRSADVFDDRLERFMRVCVREYVRLVAADLSAHVVAGMPELLKDLAADPQVRLSLVTGNLQAIARLKLTRAGLGEYFPLGQGGFGSDSEDRTDLPAIARRRAGSATQPYPRDRTIVIGDTPRDIACARADGVRCIAVSTGLYAAAQLAQADAVAHSTGELRRLLNQLGISRL